MDDFERELIESQEQRSQGWRDARCGKFTSSEVWKLLGEPRSKAAKEAGGWSDTAMTYIKTKVAEELTGLVHESGPAYPVVWGEEQEENAKAFFTNKTGLKVKTTGFIAFTEECGGSPDGRVNDDQLIEIKSPFNSTNQVEYLSWKTQYDIRENKPEYWWQMQANMLFAKANLCLFIAYDPRMNKDEHKMKIIEVFPLIDDQQFLLDRIEKAIETKKKILSNLNLSAQPLNITTS